MPQGAYCLLCVCVCVALFYYTDIGESLRSRGQFITAVDLGWPDPCSNFKTVAGAKFKLARQTSTPKQRFRETIEDAIQTRCGQCQFQISDQYSFGCGHPT